MLPTLKCMAVLLIVLFNGLSSYSQIPNDEIATATDIDTLAFSDLGVNFALADSEGPVPAADGARPPAARSPRSARSGADP